MIVFNVIYSLIPCMYIVTCVLCVGLDCCNG